MNTTTIKSSFVLAVAFAVTLLMQLALIQTAHAAQTAAVWDGEGTTDDFSEAANWAGDTIPTGGESVYLDTAAHTGSSTFNNDLVADTSFESIVLVGTGSESTYTLTGNSVILTSAEDADKGINGGLINATDQYEYKTFIVALDITLAADMDFYAGGKLIVGASGGLYSLDLATFTMTKTGEYPLIINSTPTGSGDMTVSNGEFVVTKDSSIAILIANGGKLKGTGTVGDVTVNSGGEVSPGLSPGCLTTGNIAYTAGSTYTVEVNGPTVCSGYDQTIVVGTVALGDATLNIVHQSSPSPVATGATLIIIDNDGADAVVGTFSGLAEGGTTTVDGVEYTVSYAGGDGNDVVLSATAVAAPATGFGSTATNYMFIAAFTALATATLAITGRKLNKVKN